MTILVSLAIFAAATSLAPLAIVRGELRRRFAMLDAGVSALALALWLLLPRLSVSLEPDVALAVFMVAKLVALSLFLAGNHESEELAWAPWKGALVAGAVYVALVPFVLRAPVDGDEPFYLLVTESIVRDGDVDLRNQFTSLERSATRRTDLVPQFGDPVGPAGEKYSRHEPLLSFLLVPGYLAGGLHGAVATIALFAALAVASMLLLLEEEGVSRRTILVVFPLLAFGPPLLAYATRIWPEAPAALLFSEALRAARQGRRSRAGIAIVLLALLKLRFAIVSVALVVGWMLLYRESRKKALVVFALLAIPAAAVLALYPQILALRMFDPEDVFTARNYLQGTAGMLVDGQAGLLFQAPLWLLGLVAALRWRDLGASAKLGLIAAAPYLLLLFPRSEWHGGWSPPLRYVVVFLPLFALLAAHAIERITSRGAVIVAAIWSAGLTIHGLAFPTGLFQIATGESVWGRWISSASGADASRLVPSTIRPNVAAAVAIVVLAALVAWSLARRSRTAAWRPSSALVAAVLAIVLTTGFAVARRPGERVELEDAHVRHDGGSLYPEEWTVARFRFRGGWSFGEGASASFLFAGGRSTLWYSAQAPATIEIGGRRVELAPTGASFSPVAIDLPRTPGRYTLRCVKGDPVVDRIDAE
ncbi:MAG: hypothetical protein NDJ92_08735 [Thermoanaerobaculia bacterium]|nr:hypothetical protein [Thermoanaerobaculia bacterium]